MTSYLETLVRILPRQRRTMAAQRSRGFGMVIVGMAMASVAATVLLVRTPTAPTWALAATVFWLLVGGYLILFGGYRATRADLILTRIEADMKSVDIALRRTPSIKITASTQEFRDELERFLERNRRDGHA
jgi:hypothetical protein